MLVMEYFLRIMSKMSIFPNLKYHPMCKKLKLTHLIFADDHIIFCKGNVCSVQRVMKALDYFSVVTRLEANITKSNLFLAGINVNLRGRIIELTDFLVGTFPIRCLGLPLSLKK